MQISAKVIQHSKCADAGKEVVTFELIYPRFILAELNTHRVLSKNSASSRAIPIAKVIEQVRENPATPSHWGKNQPGMQAKEELGRGELIDAKDCWVGAAQDAADWAGALSALGLHKQATNRLLEPFQWMKTVLTGTEFANFFWLRDHEDAQPEIRELARAMKDALDKSTPFEIYPGEWHVPYVNRVRDAGGLRYLIDEWVEGEEEWVHKWLTIDEALAVSSSCSAQVSYRVLDDSLEKAKKIYERLVESEPVHASPFEHQASPIAETIEEFEIAPYVVDMGVNNPQYPDSWEEGITHVDRDGNFWSGNFQGFIQHRQLIPNNAKRG